LIYAVCSLQPEEGAPRLAAANLRVTPILPEELPGLPEAITRGRLAAQLIPGMWADRGGMDGFFAAGCFASDLPDRPAGAGIHIDGGCNWSVMDFLTTIRRRNIARVGGREAAKSRSATV